MDKKKNKAVKALHQLSIGEIFVCSGLLIDLAFLTEWLNILAIFSLVGVFIMLFGVIKLRKINKYFFYAFLSVLGTFILAIVSGALDFVLKDQESALTALSTVRTIVTKIISLVYMFGIVRGCALAATGEKKSKFGFHMVLVNFFAKAIAIVLNLVVQIFLKDDPTISGTLTIIATIVTVFAELYFCVYLFRTHRKAKALLKNA